MDVEFVEFGSPFSHTSNLIKKSGERNYLICQISHDDLTKIINSDYVINLSIGIRIWKQDDKKLYASFDVVYVMEEVD